LNSEASSELRPAVRQLEPEQQIVRSNFEQEDPDVRSHGRQSDAYGGVHVNRTTKTQEDSREVSEFYHPSKSSKEDRSTRKQRRYCSNFISEERTPDVQVLNEPKMKIQSEKQPLFYVDC